MDDLVKAAMLKWPHVPACHGWLGLDARGQWWMRDAHAQSCGAFDSGQPGCKGSLLRHDKLVEFIGRNYCREDIGEQAGAWYFQNGPQKVYVELEACPWIMRLNAITSGSLLVHTHTGVPVDILECLCDEQGWGYLNTSVGIGLVHTQDMPLLAQALEQSLWPLRHVSRNDLSAEFGYILSPARLHRSLHASS